MKLSRRTLKLRVTGEDVRLLHTALVQLGLPVPQPEQEHGAFLQGTYQAVVRFQKEHELDPTGVVNAETARAIHSAVSALSGKSVLATSDIRYNAASPTTLDIVLPANCPALPSEYESLTAALTAHYTGGLGNLQEDQQHQDITYLANKTGWDARLIAM